MTTRSAVAALTAALMLALACTSAEAKTKVGSGDTPSATATSNGTVHVVWTSYGDAATTVHYCQVAPGTETCARTKDFVVGATAEAWVVHNPSDQKVHVVIAAVLTGSTAPFNQGDGVYTAVSNLPHAADGTFTTAARRTSATTDLGNDVGEVVFGPGNFEVALMSSVGTPNGNARITFARTGTGDQAKADDVVPGSFEKNLGLITQGRVLAVSRKDDDTLYWRSHKGGDAANVAANWNPLRSLPGQVGSATDLASNGLAPPALFSRDQVGGTDWRLAVRRYDAATDSFGPPVMASDDDYTYQPEAFMDASSNVHALFVTNSPKYRANQLTALVYTASQTGAVWPSNGIVLDRDLSTTTPTMAAGPDGTGVAVWTLSAGPNGSPGDDDVYLGRAGGPASPFPQDPPPNTPGGGGTKTPPPAPPVVDPSCVKTGTAGIGNVLSTGCFKKGTAGRLTTTSPFLLNGLTVDPKGKTATVDPVKRTVEGPAGGTVAFGPVQLVKGEFEWTLPATGAWIAPATLDLDKAGYGASLLGLKVTGKATLRLTDGKTTLETYLKLPPPFDGVSGELDLTGDNFAGLRLDGLVAKADSVAFGFEDLELKYTSDPPTWTGTMAFRPSVLPKDESANRFSATVRIVNGTLEFVKVDGQFAAPGLSLYPPLVYLRYAGLELTTKPLTITGKTVLAGGPGGIVSVGRAFDDFGKVTVRLTDPFSLSAEGPVYVLGFKVGGGYFKYTYAGDIAFGANAKLGSCDGGIAGAEAAIDGFIHVGKSFAMNAEGKGRACLGKLSASANAVVSSKGIAACAGFDFPPIKAGAGHVWGSDSVEVMALGCDTAPYAVAQSAQAGGARTFTVASGVQQLNVALTGDAGVPQASLVGPGGVTLPGAPSGQTVTSASHAAVGEPGPKRQTFMIAKPAAGTWTVQLAAGSAGIVKVDLARDAPRIKLGGRLTRAGARRELRWSVADRTGQVVTLYEEGDGVLRNLGSARGASGVVRWAPEVVRGGKRRVTAVVEQGGLPQDRVVLASYDVPRPPRPGTARKLRATVARGALTVSWTPARGAKAQDLHVRLSSGLAQIVRLSGRARTYRVPAVAAGTTGTVRVVALRADGKQGPAARATVRAAKTKAKRKKKGRG